MKSKNKKNLNQRSFYFKDYNYVSNTRDNKMKINISEDRIYLLFFIFFTLIFIFSIKIIFTSLQNSNLSNSKNNFSYFKPIRSDIVDRNGELIARNINAYHVVIKPNFISDKKKFILKLKLLYPKLDTKLIYERMKKENYIYLKRNIF